MPIKPDFLRLEVAVPHLKFIARHSAPKHTLAGKISVGVILHHQLSAVGAEASVKNYRKVDIAALLHGSLRVSVKGVRRIKQFICVQANPPLRKFFTELKRFIPFNYRFICT